MTLGTFFYTLFFGNFVGQDDSKKYQSTIEEITAFFIKEIDLNLKNKEEDLKKI